MQRTRDTINGTVAWDISESESWAFCWVIGIILTVSSIAWAIAAYNIVYVIHTPAEMRLEIVKAERARV